VDFRVWLAGVVLVTFLGLFNVGKAPSQKELLLSGDWLFKTGDNVNWKEQSASDSDWVSIKVPAAWENQGYPGYDGVAWYRKHIVIPAEWQNSAGIIFDMGKVDDEDEVYFNGELIGAHSGWQDYHKYSIAKGLVKFDQDNLISIRVNDSSGNGGYWEGACKLVTGVMARYKTLDVDSY
jgi:beta-galactosidase/beta-glucuronidase